MKLSIKQKIFAISLIVGLGIFGFYNVKNLNKPTIGRKQGLRWIDTQAETVKGLRNQEIVKADAKSTHFKNEDGTITAYITDFNQNALDKNGNWKPIDFSLKKIRDKDYDYKIASGLDIKVSKKGAVSNGLLEIEGTAIEVGGFDFTEDPFSPIPYKIKSSKLDNTTLKSKTKDFDLHIDVTDQTIKHEIIIKNKKYIEDLNSEYIALKSTLTTKDIIMLNDVRMPSGIHHISKDDLVRIGDSEKNINTIIPFPESWDKNDTDIETLRYVDNKDFYTLDVYTLVRKTDLLSSDIQFPITIDPDFEGDSTDGFVNHYDTNYSSTRGTSPVGKSQNTTVLRIGQSFAAATYNIWRSLMKFDTSSIGALGVVTGVNMEITMADVTWLSTHFTPRITDYDWESDGPITDGNNITLFAGVHSGSVLASFASTSGWTVNTTKTSGSISTSTVDTTGYTLYGLQGSRDRDSNTPVARNWVDFYESGAGTASYRPVLVVTYYTPEIKGIGGDVNYDKNRTKDDGAGTLDTAYKELAADEHTVGLWHFNESYGNEYAYDSSGLSNDVTATDIESVDWKAGIANYGIDLDGTDEYFTRAYDTDFDFGSGQFTLEGWFKTSASGSEQAIIHKYNVSSPWEGFALKLSTTDSVDCWVGGSSWTTGNTPAADGQWHHAACVYDGTNVNVYIDGELDAVQAQTSDTTYNTVLTIGSHNSGWYFNGMLDEIRISNTARTPEEIKAAASRYPYSTYTSPILNTGGAVKSWKDFTWTENGVNTGDGETIFDSTGLVAQWNFNETSGTTANNDAEGTSCGGTPANCDGTLSGFDSTASQDADPDSSWTADNRRWGAGALQFDKINSSVAVSDNDSLDFSSSDSFTVLAWVKLRSKETNEAIVSKTAAYADTQANYVLDQNSAEGWQFTTSDGSGTGGHATRINSLSDYEIGKWTQVVGTYNASTDKMYLYTNGVLRSEITPTYTIGSNAGNLYIGSYITSNFFDGIIDTVQIYSRALSESEILSLYNSSNIQLETRIGGTSTPDATWEAWKPTTNSTQLNSFDSDSSNWLIDNLGTAPETSLNVSNESNLFLEGSGTLKLETSYVDTSDVNLVAYWNLDETNGDNAGDDIFDATSNNNDGEFYGTNIANAVVDGIVGKARNFDGSTDYISIPNSSTLSPGAGNFTVSAWVKPDVVNSTYRRIYEDYGSNTSNLVLLRLNLSNKFDTYYRDGEGDAATPASTTTPIAGQWYHVATVRDGTTVYIYVNGVLENSATNASMGTITTSDGANVTLGRYDIGEDRYWEGNIDEVKVSNIARTPEEIAEDYKMGANHHINKTLSSTDLSDDNMIAFDIAADKPGTYLETIIGESDYANYQTDANTLGLWHMDEQTDDACDSGNSDACDSSGNGNHGDVTSAPPIVQGKRGLARDFDGSADYINIGTMGTFGSQIGTSTTSLWVNTTDTTAEATALLKIIDASGEANDVVWGIEPNRYLTSGCTLAYTTSEYTLFYIRDTTGKRFARYITTSIQDGQWHHVVWKVTDASTNSMEVYVDGVTQTLNGTCSESPSSFNNWTDNLLIGASNNRGTPGSYLNGVIDEVRIDDSTRTTTEIRQAYEIGRRSHPITIDFAANLSSDNLITDSGDLDFTIDATAYGLPEKGSMLFENDKLIVKENVDGTEYIAQGTVTNIQHSGGYVRVLSWNTEATFPTGGFTSNATVFKWQREYFDLNDVSLDDHINAVTELTFRVTNGHEGRTVYIDDLTSEGDLMTTSTGSTIGSSTGQRYYQYKTIFSNADEFVSADVTDFSVDYVTSEPDLYMKFDENYGSTAYDSSRNGNNGTITEAVWVDSGNCISRSCLEFDGTDDLITVTDDNKLDMGTGDFSVSFWMKSDDNANTQRILAKRDAYNGDGSDVGWEIYTNANGTMSAFTGDGSGFTSFAADTTNYADNNWHHVTVVFDRSGSATIYRDGMADGSGNISGDSSTLSNSTDLITGATSKGTPDSYFEGFLDNIKIYRYARTAEEVKTDYSALAAIKGATASFSKDNRGLTDGLIGYWKMDESAANSCTGGVNDACDSSGNGYDGAWNSDATSETGKFGNGVTFDGTADDVSIADQDAFSVNNTNELTVAGWINWDSTASRYSIINKGTTSEYEWGIRSESDGSIRAIIYTDSGGTYLTAVSSASYLSTGRWYHVAFTVDLDKPSLRLYVDGTLLAEDTTTSGSYINNTSALNFGERGDGSNDFPGDLDEVRIYNKTLSPAEISKLYNWAPGPVGYWPLDENTGTTTTYDKSGNGNDGTLTSITESSWTQGKFGSALSFDGTADYVELVGHNSNINTNKGTISTWVKLNPMTDTGTIYSARGDSDNNIEIYWVDSAGYLTIKYKAGSTTNFINTTEVLDTDNTWKFITLTWDNVADEVKAYIDGVQVESTLTGLGTWGTSITDDVAIGAWGDTGHTANYLNGTVDDLKVYDYARTPSQITQDMNGGHPIGGSPIASQVGYWSFDEMAGTTANDRGTGGNSGTLNNSPTWKLPNNCKINGCINFNGSNNYISITDDDSIDIGDKLTITGWFNVNDTAVSRPILSKANEYLIRVESDDKLNFFLHDGTGYEPRLTASTNPSAGAWHHFAAVYDSTLVSNHQKLYLNGVLVAEQDRSITTTATANNLNIGLFAGTYFDGELDEIKLYNTALTASEILVDMNAGSNAALGGVLGTGEKSYLGIGDTGPVGWWKLDENTGTSTTYDSSGNENDGTLISITEGAWTQGKYGSALEFDGSADYVDITNSTDFDIANPTISAWVYSDDFDQNMFIFEKGPVNTQYSCFFQGTNIIFRTHNTTPTTDDLITDSSDAGVSPNQWNHIACVYDGSNKIIYVNGVQAASKAYTQTLQTGQSGQRIGAYGGTPSYFFDGRIDEVKIFSYPLSSSQVAYEYNRGKPVGHWKLDECTGTTANDASGNANHGTINIGATGTNTSAGTCTGSAGEAWNDGATGKYNASLEFDGTDDYITSTPPVNGLTEGSLAIWVKFDNLVADAQTPIGIGNAGDGKWRIDVYSDGRIAADFWLDGNATAPAGTITTDKWYHLVSTFDGTTKKIYVNGVLMASAVSSVTPVNASTALISGYTIGSYNVTGQMDDARIYNYAVSENQVKNIYNGAAAQSFR